MKWLDRVLHKRSKPSSTSLHVASPLGEVLARYYQQRNEWLEDSRRAETLAILDQNRPERAHGQRIGRAVYIGLGSFAPCKDAGDSGVKVMSQLVRFLDIVDHLQGGQPPIEIYASATCNEVELAVLEALHVPCISRSQASRLMAPAAFAYMPDSLWDAEAMARCSCYQPGLRIGKSMRSAVAWAEEDLRDYKQKGVLLRERDQRTEARAPESERRHNVLKGVLAYISGHTEIVLPAAGLGMDALYLSFRAAGSVSAVNGACGKCGGSRGKS